MSQVIMTTPLHFAVEYEINPWMNGNINQVNSVRAAQQWSELRNTLVDSGADVVVLPPPEAPDAVFIANAGLIFGSKFLPSRFKHKERQVEEAPFFNLFSKFFDIVTPLHEGGRLSFEGAGDAMFDTRNNLWFGFGQRSSGDYKFVLDEVLESTGAIVRGLQLVDPNFYHLDTCFCPLDTGEVLWFPPAFDEYGQHVIESMFRGKHIPVSAADAKLFACNAVSLGETIVMPQVTPFLVSSLTSRGYTVKEVDVSEFIKAGGACKCLTLRVNE